MPLLTALNNETPYMATNLPTSSCYVWTYYIISGNETPYMATNLPTISCYVWTYYIISGNETPYMATNLPIWRVEVII